MTTTSFGTWAYLCRNSPSLAPCNLFFRQLLDVGDDGREIVTEGGRRAVDWAGVGVRPTCEIRAAGVDGGLGNIAQIIACVLSLLLALLLSRFIARRRAAVGRTEFLTLMLLYALLCALALLTTGGLIEQGSSGLVVLTAVQMGLRAAWWWMLVGNAVVATQIVEDGTMAALVPFWFVGLVFFFAVGYISLDTGLGFSDVFGPSQPYADLKNITLFVLLLIWPLAAALIFTLLTLHTVIRVLREGMPLLWYGLSLLLFGLAQGALFALGHTICSRTSARIDGAFVATLLEVASLGMLFWGWRAITEEDWEGYTAASTTAYMGGAGGAPLTGFDQHYHPSPVSSYEKGGSPYGGTHSGYGYA